jgi:predicted RNase H-like HicB family nuclease
MTPFPGKSALSGTSGMMAQYTISRVIRIARHPEFGDISGPVGTGSSPEEALADLREARQSLIGVLLERGDPIPEPGPVKTAVA